VYSVISPEGCAAILWKSASKAADAAEILGITAHRLKSLGLIDRIINEPVGGAHRDHVQMASLLKRGLSDSLRQLQSSSIDALLDERHRRILSYGKFKSA
jgi:acetyl-CoA carboxylase carboxyl transferase subunit alpha